MSYFLNEENELKLSEFLVKENKKICKEQLKDDKIPENFRDLMEKTIETGSPLPFFDPRFGYYSVSFTPCENGTRIYAHHHISNNSECIHDPANVTVIVDDSEEEKVDESFIETPQQSLESSLENMNSIEDESIRDSINSIPINDDGITGMVEINE